MGNSIVVNSVAKPKTSAAEASYVAN